MTLSYDQAIAEQRKLAKLANFVDNFVRIPFTRVGVGADSAVGTFPVVGDAIGIIMFGYVFAKARHLGLPASKVGILIVYAGADLVIGCVPGLGDVADIFSRPSRHAVKLVSRHLAETHGIEGEVHIDKPMLHEFLENKGESGMWANPMVRWITLHLPDLIGLAFIIIFFNAVVQLVTTIWNGISGLFG